MGMAKPTSHRDRRQDPSDGRSTKSVRFQGGSQSDGPLAYATIYVEPSIWRSYGSRRSNRQGLDYTDCTIRLLVETSKFSKKVEGLGGKGITWTGGHRVGGFEVKLYGPEGVLFDIAEHP